VARSDVPLSLMVPYACVMPSSFPGPPAVPPAFPGSLPAAGQTATIEQLRQVGLNGPAQFTEEEWDLYFGRTPDTPDPPPRWWRVVVALLIMGMLATSALIAWRVVFEDRNKISEPAEVELLADGFAAESPYEWLVTDIVVVPIDNIDIGGFVRSAPADGVISIDRRPWDERELAEVVHHEIGHLLDFSAYNDVAIRRGGLESEVWAECAAVDAGVRDLDDDGATQQYRCTASNFRVYQTALSLLDTVCKSWGDRACRQIEFQP